ncbi:MAG TPA: thioredoxin-disulfide reductase [Candidatus Uhrbacteria bacterium]|nr:thioredoxin-disulfide reductase [Candidatus Uhrbacteria bacterium]
MKENIYDLIIIGAGPAGLTAGIYASRRKLNNLILTKDIGGQAATVPKIENYPGFEEIGGFELTDQMKKQAEKFGSQFKYEEVIKVGKANNFFEVETSAGNKYQAQTLILSFGVTPRNLDVPGEKEFLNKGVTYCANCDAPLYKDKIVAVVGGGNSALDAAEYLSKIAQKVYLIHRRDEFRGEEILVEKVKKMDNIELVLHTVVQEIKGDKFVNKIIVKNLQDESIKELAVEGVFIEIGHIVNASPVRQAVELDEKQQIIIDDYCRTSELGIFAAGDVAFGEYKQIIIAAGEGAKAALSAYKYLQQKKGKKTPVLDWSNKT